MSLETCREAFPQPRLAPIDSAVELIELSAQSYWEHMLCVVYITSSKADQVCFGYSKSSGLQGL